MSGNRVSAPKGTRDVLPPETALWAAVEAVARRVFSRYGFSEIRTPIFEDTDLFARGVGESSDIVGKEMYSFVDRGDRRITLRPESTAAVCRAYVEHGMHRLPPPVKLYYIGPQFRYERPQKGRYRQFHQIGAELLGARPERAPEADAEAVLLLVALLGDLGFSQLKVLINTVGDDVSRSAYRATLVEYLQKYKLFLSEDSRRRLETNPLRILDSKSAEEQQILADAPQLGDSLTELSRAHFERVIRGLDAFSVRYEVSPRLVRGLDYYTNTVFEIVSEGLGSQNAICGGGAYEKLVQELGGPPTYAVGFAIGEDRLVEVLPANSPARTEARQAQPSLVVVSSDPQAPHSAPSSAFVLAETLRREGIPAIEGPSKAERAFERAKQTGSPAVPLAAPDQTREFHVKWPETGFVSTQALGGFIDALRGRYPELRSLSSAEAELLRTHRDFLETLRRQLALIRFEPRDQRQVVGGALASAILEDAISVSSALGRSELTSAKVVLCSLFEAFADLANLARSADFLQFMLFETSERRLRRLKASIRKEAAVEGVSLPPASIDNAIREIQASLEALRTKGFRKLSVREKFKRARRLDLFYGGYIQFERESENDLDSLRQRHYIKSENKTMLVMFRPATESEFNSAIVNSAAVAQEAVGLTKVLVELAADSRASE